MYHTMQCSIEEILNYFNISESDINKTNSFQLSSQLTTAVWNHQNQLLFLKFKAPSINTDSIPATNLVFLIDCSGSMDQANACHC